MKSSRKGIDLSMMKDQDYIKLARDNIYKQAGMAGLAVLVTLVLVFAMSVAWYSNVIHNEGLVFQASSWDFEFEGNIEIDNEKQEIGPGESGIVNLKIENDSEDTISVLANMVKDDNMLDELKMRIYCYADDSRLINGELVDRIYINETDDYSYEILGKNTLLLSDEYHSHPYLKWEWVYDVLGYYVTGTMVDGKMEIEDYMRPVSYDYDSAVFQEDGSLLSVNHGVLLKDYVKELYSTDGYAGNEVGDPINGYYPVVVDENTGSGIWLYLCSKNEIESATALDNELGRKAAAGERYEIACRLLLSGQQAQQQEMTVSDSEDLEDQLNDVTVDKVILDGNVGLSHSIAVSDGQSVVLDLNGNSLSLIKSGNSIQVEEGSSLTVINGTLEGQGSGAAIYSVGGVVTMDHVVLKNTDRAIYVEDNKGSGLDSRIKLTNCQFDVKEVGIMLRGNSDISSRNTKVIVEKCTILSGEMGICGNGSAWGTDIEIIESKIEGYWAGIYQPQKNSVMLIKDSTILGYTAIAVKAGEVTVVDSAVEGTGEKKAAAFAASGFTDTGDAIYIETNYETEIQLTVSGSKSNISSRYSEAIQVYDPAAPHVNVIVTGGKFDSDITAFIPSGYEYVQEADGYWVVAEEAASASTETDTQ